MGKVSVIIPVFNTEEFLDSCIDSVLAQTYDDLEILLINDASKTSCTEQLYKFKKRDERIKLFHFQKRRGVGFARNFGIQQATGEYIYFLDSDDYIPPETITYLVEHIGNHNIIKGKMKATDLNSSFTISFKGLFKPKTYLDNRFNLIKNNSVLNILFKKEFVEKENLKFSIELDVYSDMEFIFPAFEKVDRVLYLEEGVYFRRRRNDPISNPSLSQLDQGFRIKQYLLAYSDLKFILEDEIAHQALDKSLLNFYRKNIVRYFYDNDQIKGIFPNLYKAILLLDKELLRQYDWVLKKEVNTIIKGDMYAFKRVTARHHFLRDLRKGLKKDRKKFIYSRIFMKLPLKENIVFFESFLGKNYSDSPKYIYEYMLKNKKKYKFVWSFNEKTAIPGNAVQVKRFSLRYYYYLARAKYWVSNSRMPKHLQKREGNIYLQTWHGTPLKRLVFDMDEIYSADPKYKANFYEQSRRWDYLSSPNQYSSEIFKRAFKFNNTLLEFGYPRNDILYQKNSPEHIKKLKRKMNIPINKKVILYAPTWRDDDYFSRGKYNFELELDLERMKEKLGEDYIILLRMHYFIANEIDISAYEGFAFNVSSYDDIAELYLVSDLLITDYSSVFFDYSNLKRPILFYTYDLEKYRDELRGFYLDINEDLPGPLLRTTEDVIHAVINLDEISIEYAKKYERFYQTFCKWDDGNATEKTVSAVFNDNISEQQEQQVEEKYRSIS